MGAVNVRRFFALGKRNQWHEPSAGTHQFLLS